MTVNKSPENIKNLFNIIAKKYDLINNLMSFFTHKFIKKSSLSMLTFPSGGKILDCCCGTGDISGMLKYKFPESRIIGLDFSEKMLEIAKKNIKDVEFVEGDCCNMDFSDKTFDAVTISFGLRNIENYKKAIGEISRVLKNGGQFLYIDFDKTKFPNKFFDIIVFFIANVFKSYKSAYKYLINSKNEFFTPQKLEKILNAEGFTLKHQKSYISGIIYSALYEKVG